MKHKEQYTLDELYDNLAVTISELSSLAHMSEVTIRRIRYKYPTRRSTANKLLQAFSKTYDRELSLENVTGFNLEDRRGPLSKEKDIAKKGQKTKAVLEKPPKRKYTPRKTDLPEGCILATDFANMYEVAPTTFRDHMMIGLGPGLIHGHDVPDDGSVQIKDYVRSEERIKRTRFDKDGKEVIERERYLTPEQQAAALEFWKRHGVEFIMPESGKA